MKHESNKPLHACAPRLQTRISQPKHMPPKDFAQLVTGLLADGHPVRFRANGHSMAPTILPNDRVTVEPVRHERPPAIGDVVLYHNAQGQLCLHRLIRVLTGSATAYVGGDAEKAAHEIVPTPAIIGNVARIERAGLTVHASALRAPRLMATYRIRGLARFLAQALKTATNRPGPLHPPVP